MGEAWSGQTISHAAGPGVHLRNFEGVGMGATVRIIRIIPYTDALYPFSIYVPVLDILSLFSSPKRLGGAGRGDGRCVYRPLGV